MKTLLAILTLIPTLAFSQISLELRIQQRLPDNSAYAMRTYGAPPPGNVDFMLGYDGVTTLPKQILTSNFATAAQGTKADNAVTPAGLSTAMSSKQDTITAGTTSQWFRGDKTWQSLATVATSGAYADLTGSPSLGTAAAQNITAFATADVPAAYYVRLRSVSTSGTATFTYRSGQETLK